MQDINAARAYLNEKGVADVVEAMTVAMVTAKPAAVLPFIESWAKGEQGTAAPSTVPTLYILTISANSFPVMAMIADGKFPCTIKPLDAMTGEHKKPEFMAINPAGLLPMLCDGNLKMGESCSIMRYLCNKNCAGAPLYPTDPCLRAKVDMMLDWRQTSFYKHLAEAAYPCMGFSTATHLVEGATKALLQDCELFTSKFLEGDFILGAEPCIADYSICFPLEMIDAMPGCTLPAPMLAYFNRFKAKCASYEATVAPLRGMLQGIKAGQKAECLTFYRIPVSANSIQIQVFMADAKMTFEVKDIDAMTGEQKKPEFLAINPLGQLPALTDGALAIGESNAIFRYLCNRTNMDAPWYPVNPALRAKVDIVLDWRQLCFYPALSAVAYPVMGFGGSLDGADEKCAKLNEACEYFMKHFCTEGGLILGDAPCIADYAIAVPLELLCCVTSYKLPEGMAAYWQRFKAKSPCLDDIAGTMRGFIESKKA